MERDRVGGKCGHLEPRGERFPNEAVRSRGAGRGQGDAPVGRSVSAFEQTCVQLPEAPDPRRFLSAWFLRLDVCGDAGLHAVSRGRVDPQSLVCGWSESSGCHVSSWGH